MGRVVVVYVPRAGQVNLQFGIENGVWGFKTAQDEYTGIQPGDLLVMGSGYSGGSPRVKLDEWAKRQLDHVHIGEVTSGVFFEETPLWPDEDGVEVSYPHRFQFEYRGVVEDVSLALEGPMGKDVADGLRRSAISQGRGYVFHDPDGFDLSLDAVAASASTTPPQAEAVVEHPVELPDLVGAFEHELHRGGLRFPENMAVRFLCGIMAKPFAILAGLSGSGKSQLAAALGRWIGEDRTHVAAVRPDWTGAEALFGFENSLLPPRDGRAAWTVPAELEFMLKAADHQEAPYLLVLDEMNLAHVERYFADVLSGMESGWPVLPNLVEDDDGLWRVAGDGGVDRIPLPENLIVVGTVNVDETTYQFSPKVLDRATTIEFRVSTDTLEAAPPTPSAIRPADPAVARTLIEPPEVDGADLPEQIRKEVVDLHRVLVKHGREFGHRTFQEMLRFAGLALRARPTLSDETVLDCLVIQKVLPRVHGSARELAPVMSDLQEVVAPSGAENERGTLSLSADKLQRMRAELEATHFTAF